RTLVVLRGARPRLRAARRPAVHRLRPPRHPARPPARHPDPPPHRGAADRCQPARPRPPRRSRRVSTDTDVAVVGAGPAGLAAAYHLARAGRTVRVLEAAEAVGGRMRTLREHGCLIDTGAEMLPPAARYPATWRLIRELGLDADPRAVPRVRGALSVWHAGRARPNAGRPLGRLTGAGLGAAARADLVRLQLHLART